MVGTGKVLGMPEDGHGYERDTFSLTHACPIFPSPGCRDLGVSLALRAHLVFLDHR